jgi:hypothetical protein
MSDPFIPFNQPKLSDPNPVVLTGADGKSILPETTASGAPVVNSEKTDALSVAARAKPTEAVADVIAEVGKFVLDYVLGGVAIKETHIDIPHALASIRRLAGLGIVPATSTTE